MLPLSFSVSLLFVLFFPTVFAQTSTLVSTSPPPSTSSSSISASVVPGSPAYSYFGCYSETTSDNSTGNSRALTGGPMVLHPALYRCCSRFACRGARDWWASVQKASDGMTVEQCLSFCGTTQYAGLEYGRECWCAPQLNTLSQKLPDTSCQLSCAGNQTELCGGSLT